VTDTTPVGLSKDITVGISSDQIYRFHDHWGFRWPVGFLMSQPPPYDGWIVQKIRHRYRTWVPSTKPTEFRYNEIRLDDDSYGSRPEEIYWEAWPVKQNDLRVFQVNQSGSPSNIWRPFPDEYLIMPDPGLSEGHCTGEIEVTGQVVLYLGPLPPEFQIMNTGSAGFLRQTRVRPDFWDDAVGTPHNLVANILRGDLKLLKTVPYAIGQVNKERAWPNWN
jgi:hypothetical protein